MENRTFEELEELVKTWAEDKEIYMKSTAEHQLKLTLEEVSETITEMALYNNRVHMDIDKVYSEIGDVVVTLINALALFDYEADITHCLNIAYEKISKRTGKMINGKFTKDI